MMCLDVTQNTSSLNRLIELMAIHFCVEYDALFWLDLHVLHTLPSTIENFVKIHKASWSDPFSLPDAWVSYD